MKFVDLDKLTVVEKEDYKKLLKATFGKSAKKEKKDKKKN